MSWHFDLDLALRLAALGAGTLACLSFARSRGLSVPLALGSIFMASIVGFLGGHLWSVFAYHYPLSRHDPLAFALDLRSGISSTGALVAGALAGFGFAKLAARPVWPILDALAVGVVPALLITRVGCSLAMDHPGTRSEFFLASAYPDGLRHDLGLYEALLAAALILLGGIAMRLRRPDGFYALAFARVYGAGRFLLDFMRVDESEAAPLIAAGFIRAADPRWLGWTPAQYLCAFAFAWAILNGRRTGSTSVERLR